MTSNDEPTRQEMIELKSFSLFLRYSWWGFCLVIILFSSQCPASSFTVRNHHRRHVVAQIGLIPSTDSIRLDRRRRRRPGSPDPLLQQASRDRYQQSGSSLSMMNNGPILRDAILPMLSELTQSLFRWQGPVPWPQALGINAVLFTALRPKLLTMLTIPGYFHSLALGTLLWTTLSWRGWSLCVLYLFLGQAVTKVRFADKEKRGLAEKRGGRRGPENVWGSAATALLCAVASVQGDVFLGIPSSMFVLGFVASLSTKLADTFASEIGKAYGRTTFLITTLQRVRPGTEGAVSAEGTAAAVVGGLALSLYGYSIGLLESPEAVLISTLAAFVATNLESVLGATLQEKQGLSLMTNEVVNFLNTLIGAVLAMAAGRLLWP